MWFVQAGDSIFMQLSDLPQLDCLLITQGLDDHCHLKTLTPLSELYPDLKVIATPNAKSLLEPLFKNIGTFLVVRCPSPFSCLVVQGVSLELL